MILYCIVLYQIVIYHSGMYITMPNIICVYIYTHIDAHVYVYMTM